MNEKQRAEVEAASLNHVRQTEPDIDGVDWSIGEAYKIGAEFGYALAVKSIDALVLAINDLLDEIDSQGEYSGIGFDDVKVRELVAELKNNCVDDRKVEPIKLELDFDDIVSFMKPRTAFIWCSPSENIPNVEIRFKKEFGEQPTNAQEAADGISDAWEFSL